VRPITATVLRHPTQTFAGRPKGAPWRARPDCTKFGSWQPVASCEHSALEIDDKLYLAVGDSVVCLSLEFPHQPLWSVQADMATCFGIHWAEHQRALISHGELEISRLSTDGSIIWRTSGADIFSESVRLLTDYVEAIDFNKSVYRLDYVTGGLVAI